MSEAQLGILNYALLALLYVFFARVLWAVWSEVKGPRPGTARTATAAPGAMPGADHPTLPVPAPTPAGGMVLPGPGVSAHHTLPSADAPDPMPTSRKARKRIPTELRVLQPKVRKGSTYSIHTEITLGRGAHCTVSLADDTYASQLHTRVFHRGAQVWVDDLGSTNGTHVNGQRITQATVLTKGDRVQVGSTVFEAR